MPAPVRGLRVQGAIPVFEFKPSVGILAKDLDKLGLDIRSFRVPLHRAIKQVMIPSFRKNFEMGGRPAWEPLSEVTYERSPARRGGPLVASGRLMRTMQQVNIWHITSTAASIQDLPQSVWYGKIHQAGYGMTLPSTVRGLRESEERGQIGTSAIPARPFVLFQTEDVANIQKVLSQWLDERIAANWLRARPRTVRL
jgi:phage gpG-like protein